MFVVVALRWAWAMDLAPKLLVSRQICTIFAVVSIRFSNIYFFCFDFRYFFCFIFILASKLANLTYRLKYPSPLRLIFSFIMRNIRNYSIKTPKREVLFGFYHWAYEIFHSLCVTVHFICCVMCVCVGVMNFVEIFIHFITIRSVKLAIKSPHIVSSEINSAILFLFCYFGCFKTNVTVFL